MEPLTHNPTAVGVGAQVIANGVRGLAGGTTASAAVTALAPAGADEISLQAAMSFAADGLETMTINTLAQQEVSRAGTAVVEAAGIYAATDAATASTLL